MDSGFFYAAMTIAAGLIVAGIAHMVSSGG